VLVRRTLKINPNFNPIPWARAESVVALLVFTAMALMGQQSTPENIAAIIKFEKPSWLFESFYQGNVELNTSIAVGINITSVVLVVIAAIIFLLGMVILFRKKANSVVVTVCGLLFVVVSYVAIMKSIS
jgi:copper resistance protein D